jgi:adenosine deaminase
MSPESAIAQYEAALPFRDMIIGIGLDSDEFERPPKLFQEVFERTRKDGFKVTNHCDFNQKDTHEHIRQVAEVVGAERIDHGMNAADRDDLLALLKAKQIGLTLCPCAYIRHASENEVFPRIRKLFDAGLLVTIASDDPAYMEDNWVLHALLMVRDKCNFTDKEMVQLQKNAITICWAPEPIKQLLLADLERFAVEYPAP